MCTRELRAVKKKLMRGHRDTCDHFEEVLELVGRDRAYNCCLGLSPVLALMKQKREYR